MTLWIIYIYIYMMFLTNHFINKFKITVILYPIYDFFLFNKLHVMLFLIHMHVQCAFFGIF